MKPIAKLLLAALLLVAPMAPAYAAQYLDTQETGEGLTLNVTRAKIIDNVLTVSLLFEDKRREEASGVSIDFTGDEASIVANGKKYPVLKDLTTKDWVAAPLGHSRKWDGKKWRDMIGFYTKPGEKNIVWMKFPAPPVGTDNVELLMPNVAPLMFKIER